MDNVNVRDHGQSDDDSFEDAQELHVPGTPVVPTTRVEKTDDTPSHGEVPGTEAYEKRKTDAVPDQLEVVPEGSRSRSSSIDQASSSSGLSSRRASVPKMVVEKVDPGSPSHGEVPGTEAYAMRQADAKPDEVLQASEIARSPINGVSTDQGPQITPAHNTSEKREEDAASGDNFDDFAEGGNDDEFGEFDDGDQLVDDSGQMSSDLPASITPQQLLDFTELSSLDATATACQPFIDQMFANTFSDPGGDISPVSNSFLNERSHSLWSQLVAPPALQPPNWTRSRTRRLFLVSLGVPVDLDEILPASKQKKLVLPSIDLEQERVTPQREGLGMNEVASRSKQPNLSASSTHGSSLKSERKRKGPPPPPAFDDNIARMLCLTTSEALNNLTDEELLTHKQRLEELKQRASDSLEYWLIQRDNANGDKEAFEEVIQNLVKHAQKIRT